MLGLVASVLFFDGRGELKLESFLSKVVVGILAQP